MEIIMESYEDMVNCMIQLGIPRHKAESQAQAHFKKACNESQAPERPDLILEKQEQQEIIKRFRVCGFKVYVLSQPRASKQTPGLPDLWCMHYTQPVALWWESKKQVGGKYSPDQKVFAGLCLRAMRSAYGNGDRFSVEQFLVVKGLGKLEPWGIEPTSLGRVSPDTIERIEEKLREMEL